MFFHEYTFQESTSWYQKGLQSKKNAISDGFSTLVLCGIGRMDGIGSLGGGRYDQVPHYFTRGLGNLTRRGKKHLTVLINVGAAEKIS